MMVNEPMTDPMELADRLESHMGLADMAEVLSDCRRAAACIRGMVEWRPIETFTGSGQNESVMVAVPNGEGGFIVGEAWRCVMSADDAYRGLSGWWWAGTGPGDYIHAPIRDMNHGDPVFWLPLPPAPGAEDA